MVVVTANNYGVHAAGRVSVLKSADVESTLDREQITL